MKLGQSSPLEQRKNKKIMAHKLEKRDKQFGVVQAWHGLTHVVPVLTKEICFPWQVIPAQSGYLVNGEWVSDNGFRKLLASDDLKPLGFQPHVNCAGENASYTYRTPHNAWDYSDRLTAGTNAEVVSAGTVQNRSKYFISKKLHELESLTLDDGSIMELVLNILGSLDKSLHESAVLSGTRTVCYNTLMMNFLQEKNIWKTRHSKNMDEKLEVKAIEIEKIVGFSAVVKATFNAMLKKPCDIDRAQRIYTGFIVPENADEVSTRAENMVAEHVEAFQSGDGNSGRTEFDLLNGWTQPRTRGYSESKKDKWDVYETSEFGAYATSKSRFAELLLPANREELDKIEARGRELLTVN